MIFTLKDYADGVAKIAKESHITDKELDEGMKAEYKDVCKVDTNGLKMESGNRKLQWESEVHRRKSHVFVWAIGVMMCGFASLAHATNMIVGDSHVGGLKPYLSKHMIVRYKNGSTSSYWLRQPTYPVDKLVIHTGTNEQFNGTPAKKWLDQTISLCWKWNPRKCYIVAPPANKRGNYKAYRSVLYSRRNIIYTQSNDMRDAVHYKPSGYKRMASQILSAIRAN